MRKKLKIILLYIMIISMTMSDFVVAYDNFDNIKLGNAEDSSTTSQTYYISSDGNGNGLSEEEPMAYSEVNNITVKGGDKLLLKRGDIFYGTLNPTVENSTGAKITISSYGIGELPIISGYKVVDKETSWKLYSEGIWSIDLGDEDNFYGITEDAINTNAYKAGGNGANIGFIEDSLGNKYYTIKNSIEELSNEYEYYFDMEDEMLYIKSNQNPYISLGKLNLATNANLLFVFSNSEVSNLRIKGTGGNGIVAKYYRLSENILIHNCIIEDIGGSYLTGVNRYGNAISFWDVDTSNVEIKNNIIKNTYDVAFTIQGNVGSGNNVNVHDNVFISNSQDSEIWQKENATGIVNYNFYNNLSINQGRGWGHDARPDKMSDAHLLFHRYEITDAIANTSMNFYNNIVYNPCRIYSLLSGTGHRPLYEEEGLFKGENSKIESNNNTYYLDDDATIFTWNDGHYYTAVEGDLEKYIEDWNQDENSTFAKTSDITLNDIVTAEVTTLPLKDDYIQNKENLDLAGGVLTIKYNENTRETISLTDNKIKVSGYDNTKIGTNTITIEYEGITATFDVNIIDVEAPEINVNYSTTLSTNKDVTVTITSNEKIQEIEGWELSEDALRLTKTYTENKTEEINILDLSANGRQVTINVQNIDKIVPILNVEYNIKDATTENVTVTITANEKLQQVEGWNLSEDGKKLSKLYTKNEEEIVTIYDLAGNTSTVKVNVSNIDRVGPEYEIEYSTTLKTNKDVTVTITSNEKIQELEGWVLSEDKNSLTKIYSENSEENIVIKDIAGNVSNEVNIKVNNIDKIIPIVNVNYSEIELTDEDVIVTITSNEELKEIESWNLSDDRKVLTKIYTINGEENVEITDLAGNSITMKISVSNIDKNLNNDIEEPDNNIDDSETDTTISKNELPKAGTKNIILFLGIIIIISIMLSIKIKRNEDI